MSAKKRLTTYLSYLEKKHPGFTGSPGHKKLQQAAQKHADREKKKEVKEEQLDEIGPDTLTRYLTKTPAWGRKELDKENPDYDKVGKRAYWQKVAREKLEKKGFKVRYPGEVKEEWDVDKHGRFRRVDERAPDLRGGVGAPLYGSVADSPVRKAAVQRPVQRQAAAPVRKPVASVSSVRKPTSSKSMTSSPDIMAKPVAAPKLKPATPQTSQIGDIKPTNIATQNPPTIKTNGAVTTAGVSTPPKAVSTISKVAGALTGGGVNIGRDIGAQTTLTPLAPRTLSGPQLSTKIQDITTPPVGSVGPKLSTDIGPTSAATSAPVPRINVTSPHTGSQLSIATKLGPGLTSIWNKSVNPNKRIPEEANTQISPGIEDEEHPKKIELPEKYEGDYTVRRIDEISNKLRKNYIKAAVKDNVARYDRVVQDKEPVKSGVDKIVKRSEKILSARQKLSDTTEPKQRTAWPKGMHRTTHGKGRYWG